MSDIRNDKIARLRREIRDELCRRLQAGEPGQDLVLWLNSLPAAQTAQSPPSRQSPFSGQDVAEWQATGFRDWLAQQAALENIRQVADEVAELEQAGAGALTRTLAQFLSAQCVVAARAAVRQAGGAALDAKTRQALCNDAVALRRGEQNAEWLRLERERLELLKQKIKQPGKAGGVSPSKYSIEEQNQILREIMK